MPNNEYPENTNFGLRWTPYEWLAATILLQTRRDFMDDTTLCDWYKEGEDLIPIPTYSEDVEEFLKGNFFLDICEALNIFPEELVKSIKESTNGKDTEDFDEL